MTAKNFYSIGEVSKMVDIKEHVLRFWEKEFPQLSPQKQSNRRRQYSDLDVKIIERIKELLYIEKFTVSGAKAQLDTELKAMMKKENPQLAKGQRGVEQQKENTKVTHFGYRETQEIVAQLKEIVQLLK